MDVMQEISKIDINEKVKRKKLKDGTMASEYGGYYIIREDPKKRIFSVVSKEDIKTPIIRDQKCIDDCLWEIDKMNASCAEIGLMRGLFECEIWELNQRIFALDSDETHYFKEVAPEDKWMYYFLCSVRARKSRKMPY